MQYHIKHKTQTNFLLAICDTEESARRWIERFDPNMWMDKTMTREDLVVVSVESVKIRRGK